MIYSYVMIKVHFAQKYSIAIMILQYWYYSPESNTWTVVLVLKSGM